MFTFADSNVYRNRSWDSFIDYCTENGLDYCVEDFDAWIQEGN